MNITETLLNNLSGGELQKLAQEMLTQMFDWTTVSNFGQVEGGNRTRRGIPDISAETKTELIFVSATADKARGKLLEDIRKSVEVFDDIKTSRQKKCIGFLNYDPNPQEVNACKKLCRSNKIVFQYYTNSDIAALLDKNHQELRKKYLNINLESNILVLSLYSDNDSGFKKIDLFMSTINWLSDDEQNDIAMVIKELLTNSFQYSDTTLFEVRLYDNAVVVVEDGQEFNLSTFEGTPHSGYGGGKFTFDKFLETYSEIKIKCKYKNPQGNFYSFQKTTVPLKILRLNKNCELQFKKEITASQKLIIPSHCNEIILQVPPSNFMMSVVMRIDTSIKTLLEDETYSNYIIKVILPKNRGRLIGISEIQSLNSDERVIIDYI